MLNLVLFVCALSAVCADNDTIFTQVETVNEKQSLAHLVASKSDNGILTVNITPIDRQAESLSISMPDLTNSTAALVTIHRGGYTLLSTTEITRSPTLDDNQGLTLQVFSQNSLSASLDYNTSDQYVQKVREPRISMSPALVRQNIYCVMLYYYLPTSIDRVGYTLEILTKLQNLPDFTLSCRKTRELSTFSLVYKADAVIPEIF